VTCAFFVFARDALVKGVTDQERATVRQYRNVKNGVEIDRRMIMLVSNLLVNFDARDGFSTIPNPWSTQHHGAGVGAKISQSQQLDSTVTR